MTEENRCPQCGAELPADAPHGLCPKCLMKVGLESDADVTAESPRLIEGPGTRIGRYKLLQLVAEGGMGLVYLAEQKRPVRRRVALKVIKPGMDSKQVIARFEAERQALALLDHPNIAHVFDAGTTKDGRPYFVMEYVKGMSITKYCDEQKLSIEKRLELFRQVCEGVQHAHQKGIIHRDIKPSNILVSIHGDKAVPKIIDFGIAKAITQPLTEKTFFTQEGQLLGTPEYMSPEQVDLATQDIDTRSDIYSLGVLLYVLLSGALPFDQKSLEKAGFAEIQRTIREEEPPHPSTRLTSLGEEAKKIAESRNTQVLTLARRLHRELEWIPLKAMRKERSRRYRSASELADDIQNYLSGAPLIAGPETAIYRAKKFVRKHAGSVATVLLVAVAIVLGLIVSTTMYFRAEKARLAEAAARTEAEQAREQEAVARTQAEQAQQATKEKAEELRRALYFNRIALADSSYREANISRVRELLALCPTDLRGWEWYRLWHISNQELRTLRSHEGQVYSASLSSDGKRIVSGSADKTIKVWDAITGTEVMTLRGHEKLVTSVSFSPDGMRIVSGGRDGTVKIWDAATGSELMSIPAHDGLIRSVSLSPDSRHIVSGSGDKTVKVWDTTTGTEVMTLRGHEDWVTFVVFGPDGKHIVSGSGDNTIKLWDAATGALLLTLRGHKKPVLSVAFSPDSQRIVSGSADNTIKVWDVASSAEVMTLRNHEDGVMSVSFSPDGKRIVSGSWDSTIKVWDVSTGTELMTLTGHEGGVYSAVFTVDGKRIISSDSDGTIKFWDLTTNPEVTVLRGHTEFVACVAFSPDGKSLASVSHDKTIKIWNVESHEEAMTLQGHEKFVRSLAFSPDGKRLVSASTDGVFKVWDTATGTEVMSVKAHEGEINSISYSPDSNRIASASVADRTVKVWDATTGEEAVTLKGHGNYVWCVAFSPDGKLIASGDEDGVAKIWDANTGAEVMTLPRRGGEFYSIYSIAFSPDGKRVISGGEEIKIWDATTGNQLTTLHGHGGYAWSVVFTPDGRRVIGGCKRVKVWDAISGTEVITLHEGKDPVWSVAISSDGKVVAGGGSEDGLIRVWKSASPEEVATETQEAGNSR